jgi:uncharacterized membrane protein YfcA
MDPINIPVGLLGGLLIGLTGMGGGAIMTPLLIVLGVTPVTAVGTDLAYSAVTKTFGAAQHSRQGTMNTRLILWLALGSVPASVVGVQVLEWLQRSGTTSADDVVKHALGVTLVGVAAIVLALPFIKRRHANMTGEFHPSRKRAAATIALGAVVGLLVGFTSVGSGSLLVPVLILFYPMTMPKLVGTDIAHAALLTTAASIGHIVAGNVDYALAGTLLIGSIPGILIGSRLTTRVPDRVLRPALGILLVTTGLRLV